MAERDTEESLNLFDDMLSALVELLEEKGIVTREEWEARIRAKIATDVKERLRRFREGD